MNWITFGTSSIVQITLPKPPPPPPNILLLRFCNQFGKSLVSSREYHFQNLWNWELMQNLICHYEVKCCKALWLQAREALWSNCKSSESRFFLCKKLIWTAASLTAQQISRHWTSRTTWRQICDGHRNGIDDVHNWLIGANHQHQNPHHQ